MTRPMRQIHMGFPMSPKKERSVSFPPGLARSRYEDGRYDALLSYIGHRAVAIGALKMNGFDFDLVCGAMKDLVILGVVKITGSRGARVVHVVR